MEHSFNRVLATWPALIALHFLFATAGSLLCGFLPEFLVGGLYYNTGIEAYSPLIALIGFFLGYFLSFRILVYELRNGHGHSAFSGCWLAPMS